jgi:hypothetical protein
MSKKKPQQTREEIMGLAAEPGDLGKRRADLIDRLEADAAKTAGPVQQVLRKLQQLLGSTDPSAAYQGENFFKDVAGAMQRLVKFAQSTTEKVVIPAVVLEVNDYIRDHAASLRKRMETAGIEVTAEAKAVFESAQAAVQTFKDEMARAPAAQVAGEKLGNVDAPVKGEPAKPEKVPENLKNWVNPGLGRIGNK